MSVPMDWSAPRALYFDCPSGAAGDMLVGALIDSGVPATIVTDALAFLDGEIDVRIEPVVRGGVRATRFRVEERAPVSGHPHRHLRAIVELVQRSSASETARARTVDLLTRLAAIEADIHGTTIDKVHLHEVGGTDSIADVLGAVVALEWLAPTVVACSPINVGSGTVRTAHGVLPVPAPATARLLEGVPVYADGDPMERLTPTGALLLTSYAGQYGGLPAMRLRASGYGAGEREDPHRPNVVRVLVGEHATRDDEAADEVVSVLDCQVDDASPQVIGAFMDRALQAGALDVYFAPVGMKKNRPGTHVTIIARPDTRVALAELVFREIPTLGVRYHEERRRRLARHHETVTTAYGDVRVKIGRHPDGRIATAAPEFDDCARLAAARGVAVRAVLEAALHAWRTCRPPD